MEHDDLTYADVGATADKMPSGYSRIEVARQVGVGADWFETARDRILTWDVQRRAGFRIEEAPARVRLGAEVMLSIGVGPLRLPAPVRVVSLVDEPTAVGLAYGTLAGHPEAGEERTDIRLEADDTVWARVRAFARPHGLLRLGTPLLWPLQRLMADRYLAALTRPR